MRLYWSKDSNCYLPSVSTILKMTRDSETTQKMIAYQKVVDKIQSLSIEDKQNLPKYKQRYLENPAEKGTNLHNIIKAYLNDEIKIDLIQNNEILKHNIKFFSLLKSDLYDIIVEQIVFSSEYHYAGKFDLVALSNCGLKSFLGDWKTSYRPKRKKELIEAFLQATAYILAWNEYNEKSLETIKIICLSSYRSQIYEESVNNFRDQWIERTKKFYKDYIDLYMEGIEYASKSRFDVVSL